MPEKIFTREEISQIVFRILLVLIVVSVVVYFTATTITAESTVIKIIEKAGYLGLFGVSIVSGFNVFLPIPVITLLPILKTAGFSTALVILTASLGMTVGDMLGYGIGAVGRKITHDHAKENFIARALDQFQEKHKLWPYFLLALYVAFAPLPNELAVIPMAFAGYKLRYIFPTVLIGNLLFNVTFALGITGILNLL